MQKEKDELDALKTLDPEKAIQSRWVQLTKFANIVTRSSQKDLFHITAKEVADKQLAIYTPEQQHKLCKWLSGIELVRRPDRSKEISQDVEFAIRHMFERKSVIKTHELYTEILNHARGQRVDLAHMKSMVAAHPELVQGRGGNVTTLTHLRREVESLLWTEEGKGKGIALEHRANDRLTAHQNEAVKSLLECQDQFSALSGAAGVGKTHSLAAVIEPNLAAGRKVWIIATSDEAAKVLIKDAEKLPPGSAAAEVLRSAVNTQRFLTDPRLHNALGPGDLLISDESSMASTEQGREIMKWARGHEARVLFTGDQDQLTSVDAGDFFRIILDGSGIHTAHLSEILRQEKTALDGHYLKACQLFKLGKTTEAFYQLDLAGRIFEIQGKSRVQAIADAIIRSQDEGVAAMAVNPTHRENDAISEAVRIRKHERGELADERTILAHRSLGWSEAQKAEIRRIQPGQILEIIRGKGKGKAWEVVSVDGDHGIAQDYNGARWTFNASNAAMFDVCERRELKVAIGDTLLIRAGAQGKNGSITNGERLTIVGWDAEGRPVSTDGRSIVIGNLSYAYASTVYKSQGSTTMRVIPGFDRESVRNSSAQVAYTACSRGVRDLWLFVENKADLALIEKHTGIRQAATEMEIDKAGPTFRSEAQKLFDQLEQFKARQTPEHPRQAKTLREHVVNLCQKVADAIGWNQKISQHTPDNIMKVDLQELARKMSPEQHVAAEQSHLAIMKAAQRAEQHEQGRGMEI